MSIRVTHKFNRRHKIVIAICTIVVLLLNIGPYKVFTAPDVETEHSQCVEFRKDPLCTQGGEIRAYEVSKSGTSLKKIDDYSTCAEYNANPNMVEQYGEGAWVCWGIFFLAEIAALICCIIGGIVVGIKKIIEWTNTDYPEDEKEEK